MAQAGVQMAGRCFGQRTHGRRVHGVQPRLHQLQLLLSFLAGSCLCLCRRRRVCACVTSGVTGCATGRVAGSTLSRLAAGGAGRRPRGC